MLKLLAALSPTFKRFK